MRILKPFGMSKGTDSGLPVTPQQVLEVPSDPTITLSKSECCKIILEEAAKKQKQFADHKKQFKKEYREKQKEYQEHKKEYKEHKKEYKEFKKEYREHKKEYRRRQRQHYSENFDTYLVDQIGFGGGSSYDYVGPLAQSDPSRNNMCPIEKQRLKSQNLTASWSISSVDSRNKSSRTGCEDSRPTFNNDSKLRFGKISLLPATKVKNKLNQYRIALSPSSSNPKFHSDNNIPELRRTTSQSSLETITDAKQRKSENISSQSHSSTVSSIAKYEISDSTLNAADSTADELAESLCSLETASLTDKSLSSVVSSDLSIDSHSSSSASSFSVRSNNFNRADVLNSETSSINHDFIEFNQRFEVMHNLNPTIPIQHQRLTALNSVLPDRLNSMTESVSTFSTGSEIEFSDIETYQTRRTNSSERDEEDDVKIVVRGEEPD